MERYIFSIMYCVAHYVHMHYVGLSLPSISPCFLFLLYTLPLPLLSHLLLSPLSLPLLPLPLLSHSLPPLFLSLSLHSLLPSSRRKAYSRDYRQCGVGYTSLRSRVWRWPSNTAATSINHTLERYATQYVYIHHTTS